jgi:hypothetical protein
VVRQFHLQKYF